MTSTLVQEKAAIPYPITPETSPVCVKEGSPRLESSLTGTDLVSRTLLHVYARTLNCSYRALHGIPLPWELDIYADLTLKRAMRGSPNVRGLTTRVSVGGVISTHV